MKRNGEIEKYDNVFCVVCSKKLYSYDEYHTIKRNKKVGGGFVHVHKACYEKLLPKNKKQKNNLRKR